MSSTPRTIDAGIGLGEIFVDKYRVDAILGHGGMGVVALCTHLALNEQVAIKMLRRDVLDDADAVERFMREAQAASKLKSEYVARVTDVGRSEANVPYMVMEYLAGHDLDELLEERGTIQQPLAVELTLQACEALAEAHSLGIVHRDIKPSNLFVTWRPDGSALVKVLDFGISKALTGDVSRLTETQSLLGTPAYMSPEQMRSARHVDARTDIWSLGTVLYEMLEGRRPFEAESFSEMCVKVAVDPPGPMPNTPPGLQQVVLRCLSKPPELRYASMAELGRDLVPFSRDPHQANVLAERMVRTLRRSQVLDWEPLVAPLSSPVRAPAPPVVPPIAAPAAANAGAAASAAPEPRIAPRGPSEPIAAERSLETTYRVPHRRRTAVIVAAVAIAAATAIGVAVSRTRSSPNAAPPAQIAAPPPTATAPPAASIAQPEPVRAADAPATAASPDAADRVRAVQTKGTARPKSDRSTKGNAKAATSTSPESAKTIEPAPPADHAAGSDIDCVWDSSHDGCQPPGSKPRN
ncbi:MAG TPA: serine/threonine-protein kinase [Kofleriaceae bacterium]|nr:serine/threonine-protein kinase [Kofleriaceae bacterium]